MTLLTFKTKYVDQSTSASTYSSTTLAQDISRTFTLTASQTVLVIYQSNNNQADTESYYGTKCAVNIDGTDHCVMAQSPYDPNKAVRNTCFWVGTLAAGSHTVKGMAAAVYSSTTVTVSNRILLTYIFDGDEFRYVEYNSTQSMTGTTLTNDSGAYATITPSGACKALALYGNYSAMDITQNEAGHGRIAAINIGGTDYATAGSNYGYSTNMAESVTTCYAKSVTATSTTFRGRYAGKYSSGGARLSNSYLGVMLLADSTLIDVAESSTQVSTTSGTFTNDSNALISRTLSGSYELLTMAMENKNDGTSEGGYGHAYGINVDSAQKQITRVAIAGSAAESSFTCYAQTATAGSRTVQGAYANNYSTSSAVINSRVLIALWLYVPPPVITEYFYKESLAEQTGSSGTVTLTFTPTKTDNYVILGEAQYHGDANADVITITMENGGSIYQKSVMNNTYASNPTTAWTLWQQFSGMKRIACTANTPVSIDIKYSASANTAHLRNIRILAFQPSESKYYESDGQHTWSGTSTWNTSPGLFSGDNIVIASASFGGSSVNGNLTLQMSPVDANGDNPCSVYWNPGGNNALYRTYMGCTKMSSGTAGFNAWSGEYPWYSLYHHYLALPMTILGNAVFKKTAASSYSPANGAWQTIDTVSATVASEGAQLVICFAGMQEHPNHAQDVDPLGNGDVVTPAGMGWDNFLSFRIENRDPGTFSNVLRAKKDQGTSSINTSRSFTFVGRIGDKYQTLQQLTKDMGTVAATAAASIGKSSLLNKILAAASTAVAGFSKARAAAKEFAVSTIAAYGFGRKLDANRTMDVSATAAPAQNKQSLLSRLVEVISPITATFDRQVAINRAMETVGTTIQAGMETLSTWKRSMQAAATAAVDMAKQGSFARTISSAIHGTAGFIKNSYRSRLSTFANNTVTFTSGTWYYDALTYHYYDHAVSIIAGISAGLRKTSPKTIAVAFTASGKMLLNKYVEMAVTTAISTAIGTARTLNRILNATVNGTVDTAKTSYLSLTMAVEATASAAFERLNSIFINMATTASVAANYVRGYVIMRLLATTTQPEAQASKAGNFGRTLAASTSIHILSERIKMASKLIATTISANVAALRQGTYSRAIDAIAGIRSAVLTEYLRAVLRVRMDVTTTIEAGRTNLLRMRRDLGASASAAAGMARHISANLALETSAAVQAGIGKVKSFLVSLEATAAVAAAMSMGYARSAYLAAHAKIVAGESLTKSIRKAMAVHMHGLAGRARKLTAGRKLSTAFHGRTAQRRKMSETIAATFQATAGIAERSLMHVKLAAAVSTRLAIAIGNGIYKTLAVSTRVAVSRWNGIQTSVLLDARAQVRAGMNAFNEALAKLEEIVLESNITKAILKLCGITKAASLNSTVTREITLESKIKE